MRHIAIVLIAALATSVPFVPVGAQNLDGQPRSTGRYSEGIIGQFDPSGGIGVEPAKVSAQIAPATDDRPAVLVINVTIAEGRHTYSITQPPGGPLPTRIELDPSPDYRKLDEFRAYPEPDTRIEQGIVWTGLEIQEHKGDVTWYVPIEIAAGVDPARLEVKGNIHLEVCQAGGYCEPVEKTFTAKSASNLRVPIEIEQTVGQSAQRSPAAAGNPKSNVAPSVGSYKAEPSAVTFAGQVTPATVRPGESTLLEFTATLSKGSRIYAHADRDDKLGTKPVLIAIDTASGLMPHRATTDATVKTDSSVPQFGTMKYHEEAVTWTMRVDVPKTAPPGDYPIRGVIGYQACEYRDDGKNVCELPHAIDFAASVYVGDKTSQASAPITFMPGTSYPEAAKVAARFASSLGSEPDKPAASAAKSKPAEDRAQPPVLSAPDQYDLSRVRVNNSTRSIGYYIALAFVGGLILNLMPCVLPVISLKVMSFVEQAGKSRAHALALNLWYSAGIISVFLLLGLLAATINLSWGQQFGSTAFNVTMAAIVFAMALSLLGVWEVPIPGFFGSGSINRAASQEGALGAFLKGVITTVLATPCTAPFMATAVAWAVTQSLGTKFIVFATLGVGMASPYLLIGVYPELLRFLPKPGAWMETFKQLSGFVLLATVVFILSFIGPTAVVPTLLLLLGIAIACWLVARTPLTAEFRDRAWAWSGAAALIVVFIAFSFGWLYRITNALTDPGWQPFSLARLKQVAVDDGRTVLVDFGAEWCPTCKVLEQTVLHTESVEQAIKRAGVVTMYGDFTHFSPEIKDTIRALGKESVPTVAIFPGNAPYEPIVFGGGYTQKGLIAALERSSGRRGESTGQTVAETAATLTPMN